MDDGDIHLTRHCGICGRLFGFLDRCVALIGTPDSTACRLTTAPFRYPVADYSRYHIDGWLLCRMSNCHRAKSSPESVTLHHDCFEVFGQAYAGTGKVDRLWTFALWRKPWRGSARIFLPQRPVVCSAGVATVAKRLGLPALVAKLPVEVVRIIHGYSEPATFWRLAAALDLAEGFSAAEAAGDTTSHGLRRVASWDRGQEPLLSREQRRLPIIRLTIDAFGIKKIERLPDNEPSYSKARFDELAFVIEHQADIGPGRVAVLFKNGHARLEVPKGNPGFRIWDTPSLPVLPRPPNTFMQIWSASESLWGPLKSEWTLYGRAPTHTTRFRTVDLSSVTGLTFFYDNVHGDLQGIRVHSRVAPFSMLPAESRLWCLKPVWVHVPVSAGDEVTALAVMRRGETHGVGGLIIRTRLGGVIPVGPIGPAESGLETVTLSNRPATLIHDANDSDGVSFIGAYPRSAPNESDSEILDFPTSRTAPGGWHRNFMEGRSIHFSSAPLRGIACAEVFQRGRGPRCRGILLTYKNGCRRALGDCRLGIDSSKRYSMPVLLCTAPSSKPDPVFDWRYRSVRVQFQGHEMHEHREDGWRCFKLEGKLHFWFTHDQQHLQVIPVIDNNEVK